MLKTFVLPRQGRLGTQNTGKVEKRERRFLQTDLHRTLTGQTSVINSEEGIETLERYGKESFSTAHSSWPPCKDDQVTKTGSGQTHREKRIKRTVPAGYSARFPSTTSGSATARR
jgi:hypothetical protein